jgi:hypothetical protein
MQTSGGNVGIGTGSPDSGYKLDVAGNVVFGDGGGFDMNVDGTRWQFSLGGSEKMRLDSSGNLLVGKTSADNTTAGTRIHPLGYASFTIANDYPIIANRLSSDGDIAVFRKDGTTVGSIGTTSTFTYLVGQNSGVAVGGSTAALIPVNGSGSFTNATYDIGNSTYKFQDLYLSGVMAAGDGSVTAPSVRGTDTNTGLFFPSGGITAITRNGVEGCRMDASGNFLVGTTSSSIASANTTGAVIVPNGASQFSRNGGHALDINRVQDGEIVRFRSAGNTEGSISISGSTTSYNTSSDYRLKENVVPMSGATERLKQLKPSRFNFITDANTTVDGFLAHEVQDIVPEAISGTKDAVDADGNPDYQGIDQSKLVPLLVATIQELEARITQLES